VTLTAHILYPSTHSLCPPFLQTAYSPGLMVCVCFISKSTVGLVPN